MHDAFVSFETCKRKKIMSLREKKKLMEYIGILFSYTMKPVEIRSKDLYFNLTDCRLLLYIMKVRPSEVYLKQLV
jgi:hypothetical protein